MAVPIEEFAALVGWDIDSTDLLRFSDSTRTVTDNILKLDNVIKVAAAALLGAFFVGLNKTTLQSKRLTDAVGATNKTMRALSVVARQAGFSFEHVNTLVEELNNKFGESAGLEQISAVTEATTILGLEFEKLKKLSPEDQFIAVTQAAKDLEDQQLAVSAVDILLGGEANRLIGVFRDQEGSMRDIIERFAQYNFLTEEGTGGAESFTVAAGKTGEALDTLARQLSGLLGEALAPTIDSFNDWLVVNKEIIQLNLSRFVNTLDNAMRSLLISMGVLVGLRLAGRFRLLAKSIRAGAVAASLLNIAIGFIPALIATGIAAIGIFIDDLLVYLEGGDSLIGRLLEKFPIIKSVIDTLIVGFRDAHEILRQMVRAILGLPNNFSAIAQSMFDNFVSIFGKIPQFISDLFSGISWNELLPDFVAKVIGVDADRGSAESAGIPQMLLSNDDPTAYYPDIGRDVSAATGGGSSSSVNQDISINVDVTQQPGEDGAVFAERTAATLEEKMANQSRLLNTGVNRG